MTAVLAILLCGGTLYVLVLFRRLETVVNHEAPVPTAPLIRIPESLCPLAALAGARAPSNCHARNRRPRPARGPVAAASGLRRRPGP
jgi:hypothetical protein